MNKQCSPTLDFGPVQKDFTQKIVDLHEVLQLAKQANVFSWHRDSQWIHITIDDCTTDRRTCVSVYLKMLRCEIATLQNYNEKKQMWGGYCSPQGNYDIGKAGLKALREWIREKAVQETMFPNPSFLTIYRK